MPQLDDAPPPVALRSVLGQVLVFDLEIHDTQGAPVDLADAVVEGSVLPAGGGAEITPFGVTTAANVATVTLSDAALNPRRDYDYAIYLTRSGGVRECILRGPLVVLPGAP